MTERQELYNLVHNKVKVPRRTPMPKLSDVIDSKLTKSSLRELSMDKVRTQQVFDLMRYAATNLCESMKAEVEESESRHYNPPESFYIHIVKEYGNAIPTVGLDSSWENELVAMIPESLRSKYPRVLEQILEETRDKFLKDMHQFGVDTVLLSPEVQQLRETPFKHSGRTEAYGKFLRNRRSIQRRYLLSHKLVRIIKTKACSKLPETFLEPSRYRDLGLLELDQLKKLVSSDLRKSSKVVTSRYYDEIARLTVRYVEASDNSARLLRCATRVFVQEILARMTDTIDLFTRVLGDSNECPKLKLELICVEDQLLVNPSVEEIYQTYHGVIDDVANVLQEMAPFEYWLKMKTDGGYMSVKLPDWMRREAHERLQVVLQAAFQPLNSHCARVKSKFDVVCKEETRKEVIDFVARGGRSFSECCALVDKFNGFVDEANELLANEYYAIGRLTQAGATATLKRRATGIVGIVVEELVGQHVEFNRSICQAFEEATSRALNIPGNAKDLFELVDYVSRASTEMVQELKERVQRSIDMLDSLLGIATLKSGHIELNRRTINWLTEIGAIFEKSVALCEATKCELEDEMQRRINVVNAEVDDFFPKLVILDDMDDANRIREYVEDLDILARYVDEFDEQIRWINLEERLFKFPETIFPKVVEVKEIVEPFCSLVRLVYRWKRDSSVWLDGPFEYLRAKVIREKTSEYRDRFSEIGKNYRAKMKADLSTNKTFRFAGIVDDPDPMQQPAPLKLCWQVLKEANDFGAYVPLAVCMCNPALVKRHWDEMSSIAGIDLMPNAGTTLRKVIGFDLMGDIDKYEIISVGADKELALQHQLRAMKTEWDPIVLKLENIEGDLGLLSPPDDVDVLLEEQLIKLEEMRGSYFVKPIEREVNEFRVTLTRMGGTIERWIALQSRWSELRSVFSRRGIQTELPKESKLFSSVEGALILATKRVAKDPRVRHVVGQQDFLTSMQRAAEDMERICDGVRRYVTSKRLRFSRLFFLSDKQVLLALFDTAQVAGFYLTNCFPGIARILVRSSGYEVVGHDDERLRIDEMISFEVDSRRAEDWLVQMERDVIATLKRDTFSGYQHPEMMFDRPGIVTLCVSRIHWTFKITLALQGVEFGITDLKSELERELFRRTEDLRNAVPRRRRLVVSALIVSDLHFKDVLSMLIEERVEEERDFNWQAQLRYYLEGEEDPKSVCVRMLESTLEYGYEYLGNRNISAVVQTPLTDRCYRTLVEALGRQLYGALEGPTGTGKTETVRSLARAMSILFVVFGCTERTDYICTGNIFKGVASSGAWVCLDDFDKISMEVLSVVGQQINAIAQATRSKVTRFDFEGINLKLRTCHNICVTLFPGNTGHSTLPNNTRMLFRSVAMVVPDFLKICEVELFAAGFESARSLAGKLVTTYGLCSELLTSKLSHDYGLRPLKTTLKIVARLKRRFCTEDETVLLLRALVDVHLAKYSDRDVVVFQGVLADVFPNVNLPPPNYSVLLKALERVCEAQSLECHDVFQLKSIQLLEMTRSRRGTIVLGGPMGGKTSIIRCLAAALGSMDSESGFGRVDDVRVVNPRALSVERLFGKQVPKTRGWRDGVVSSVLREFQESRGPGGRWLVLDGPLDPVCVQGLSTVLDNTGALCLLSGEKILLSHRTKVIFETCDASNVSPATVSRCGVVYVEPKSVGWRPLASSWLKTSSVTRYPSVKKMAEAFTEWLIDPCLGFVESRCRQTVPSSPLRQVLSTLDLIEMLLSDAFAEDKSPPEHAMPWTQAASMQAIVWGIGGNLEHESSLLFEEFFGSLWSGNVTEHPVPAEAGILDVPLPSEGSLRDHYYTFKGRGTWKHWNDTLKTEKIWESGPLGTIVVPNLETLKYSSLFGRHLHHRKQFLVCGEPGTGKTLCVRHLLRNGPRSSDFLSNIFTFTGQTTAAEAQELILSRLNKKKRGQYGPPESRFCVNFVDDVNVPVLEECNPPGALELLREFFDHGHWYELEEPEKVTVRDAMFVAAMTLSGRREHLPCPRFLRHFHVYAIPTLSKDSVFRIFTNVCLYGLNKNGFNADVLPVVNSLVNATLDVYSAVTTKLKPTPKRCHYLFDVRDVARAVSGFVLVRKETMDSKLVFVRLWVHEMLRVFGDRLVEPQDSRWLFDRVKDTCKAFFKDSFEPALDHLPKYDDEVTEESLRSLIFGNFIDPETRRYEEIPNLEALKRRVSQYLEEYNESHAPKLTLVLFQRALEHVARLCRILAMPGESLLFVAVDGCGRRSLTHLAAYMIGQRVHEPAAGGSRDPGAWRSNLSKALKRSAASPGDFVLLVTDRQLRKEHFQDVDSLLNTGEVPNLFSVEERQEIIEMTRLAAQAGDRNLEISSVAVMEYFTNQCKERLHLMICFSPASDTFRRSLLVYPNLRGCSVDWFESWPEEALEEVAVRFTEHVDLLQGIKTQCAKACGYFHNSVHDIGARYRDATGRWSHATIPAFRHLVRSFAELTSRKQESITTARNRYVAGLEKLQFAAGQVARMKTTLTALRPQLEMSAKQTVATMEEIENENVSVERATVLVKREEEIANKKAEIAGTLKTECEADLAVAIPILEDAIAALNTLKPADITLVKAMKNPPDTVKLVMAAVCVMLSVSPDRTMDPATGKKTTDYWGPSKRVLGDMNFLQNLKDYDKDNIPVALMNVVKKTYMTDKSFMPNIVAKASSAAEGLCKWVRAMVSYDDVAKVVAPKKEKLMAAQKECDETEAFLNEKRKTLADLNAKLAALNGSLRATLAKKMDLEKQVASCTDKLVKAENLIGSLAGEKRRWMRNAERLERFYENLAGDVLLSCAVIAYLGPFSATYRREAVGKWKLKVNALEIPCSEEYSFVGVLGSEIKISSWNVSGLSKDSSSTENAVIMENSMMWSLLIDPQNRANEWIKRMEAGNGLRVVKLSDARYMEIIEHGIEAGKPVLLENVEEDLDTPLEPVMRKEVCESGGNWWLLVGDRRLKFSQDFRFYVTTRMPNPRYPVHVFNVASVIDFSITDEGLEDQLLDIVVAKESPDLQEKIDELLVQNAANKKGLKQEEENILITLSTSTSNILEDDNAIKLLDSSKHLAVSIVKKQEASSAKEVEINEFRQRYRPFAAHGAATYRTLGGLPVVNPMYQFSLEWFVHLYVRSIETSNRSAVLRKRLDYLKSAFTSNLYESVSRSLFERDKLLYSLILYAKILLDTGKITREEVNFFVIGVGREEGDHNQELSNPAPDWLMSESWREIRTVGRVLPGFEDFATDFQGQVSSWKGYYDLENPEEQPIPSPWNEKLTEFQKLIVSRMIRPDRLIVRVEKFVREGMGDRFASPVAFDVAKSYEESNCLVPLIFLLSPGFDPKPSLAQLVKRLGFAARFTALTLGQGQDNVAKSTIKRAQRKGGWVLLENCHLAESWLPVLEKICEGFDASNTSIDFRLWLSSYPTPYLPIAILQRAVKMTNEPARNLKRNLKSRYQAEPIVDREFFKGCPGRDETFAKLLYGLSFFHAVNQNRNGFGPRGWNSKCYHFDESDFQMSSSRLRAFVNAYDQIPFEALAYLIVECHYGGRVWDQDDRKCLRALLEKFCDPRSWSDPSYGFAPGPEWGFPDKWEHRDYVAHLQGIPEEFNPEIFGLDENAAIVRHLRDTKTFLAAMVSTQGPFRDPEEGEDQLRTGIEACKALPRRLDLEEARKKYPPGFMEPLNDVLCREVEGYNLLLDDIHASIDLLEAALIGHVEWSPSLEEFSRAIASRRSPIAWRTSSAPTSKSLAAFLTNISQRVGFFKNWTSQGTPATFYLPAIASGPAFFTATRQTHARQRGLRLEDLRFEFRITSTHDHRLLSPPNTGLYIYGLFLTGGKWDANQKILTESSPKVISERLPVLHYDLEDDPGSSPNKYPCPVYRTIIEQCHFDSMSRRKDYIATVELDTEKPICHWIRRRVLILCQID